MEVAEGLEDYGDTQRVILYFAMFWVITMFLYSGNPLLRERRSRQDGSEELLQGPRQGAGFSARSLPNSAEGNPGKES